MKIAAILALALSLGAVMTVAAEILKKDVIGTSGGDLEITCIGHGSLMMSFGGRVMHIDPYSRVGDYSAMAKADLILLTHDHSDHLDQKAIDAVRRADTLVVLPRVCADRVKGGKVMENGDTLTLLGIGVEAVPAYNIVHKRGDGQPFHPRGVGNGYVLNFAGTRVYIAGDTENIPEMQALQGIDVAFLPMNLPYTMTPEMVAAAARMFKPKILYPYHFGDTDPERLTGLLRDAPEIEVRIRPMR